MALCSRSNQFTGSLPSLALKPVFNRSKKNSFQGRKGNFAESLDVETGFGLAKIQRNLGNLDEALKIYKQLAQENPNNIDVINHLGDCHKNLNQLDKAREYHLKAYNIDPKNNQTIKLLHEIDNLILGKTNPDLAEKIKRQQGFISLNNALKLIEDNAPKDLLNSLDGVKFSFNRTCSSTGNPNIAQYEYETKNITINDKYIWATPQVIAAYIVHEAVHAKDNDIYTSIQEEQDAYRESIKFWINVNRNLEDKDRIKDPELDFAASLYFDNPANLDKKVDEIYSSNSDYIPRISPYHGEVSIGLKTVNFFKKILGINSAQSSKVSNDTGLLNRLV